MTDSRTTMSETVERTSTTPSMRLSRLLQPAFLIALALLVANDWLFKPLFHNALTGKLSDFAGLFAFAYFWSIVAGRKTTAIHALIGIAFAIWKSPLSQPAIDAWNALGLMQIARVVDASDLWALAILPLSWRLTTTSNRALAVAYSEPIAESRTAWGAKFAVAGIALVAFTATSKKYDSMAIEADYVSAHDAKRIGEIAERDGDDAISAYDDDLTVRLDIDDCEEARALFTAHAQDGRTVLRLRTAAGKCSDDAIARDAVLAALDPIMSEHFGAQRVKAGMGALGEPVAMTTPARYCPVEADRASRKSKRTHDGDATYPPKKRARSAPSETLPSNAPPSDASPPEAAQPLTVPAASPETPSPSATRNSN
jgi:hypothetical protein